MKILKTILVTSILVMVVASCGNSNSSAVQTTSPKPMVYKYGTDCNKKSFGRLQQLITIQEEASSKSGSIPTTEEWHNETDAMKAVRTYVRALDIPTLATYQTQYVNAIYDFLVAYNTYFQSGKTDLSVNNYRILYNDSQGDLLIAYYDLCSYRN